MKKGVKYCKNFVCFDIETTHENIDGIDIVYTWHWSVMADDYTYYTPSTWPDFYDTLNELYVQLSKYPDERLIVYVHNLSYEIEAIIRNLKGHEFTQGFYMDTHEPLYIIIDGKFEFRCSYKLTNKSLKACGKDVGLPKLEMDYKDVVKPGDRLSPEKEAYTRRDVEIMVEKIKQLEEQENLHFWQFPYTNTGFLRDELRKTMKKDRKWMEMFRETALDYGTYVITRKAFMGGYTHANCLYAGRTMENVDSFDFGSAYPFGIATQKFPCSPLRKLHGATIETAIELSKKPNYLYICTVTMENVYAKTSITYLSLSHCEISKNCVLDNGRIKSAELVRTTCTSLDLAITLKLYKCRAIRIDELYYCRSDYLPSGIVNTMFKYYERKQKLKGQEEKLLDYMKAKNRVNSFFGMFVQDPIHDVITLDGTTWEQKRCSITSKEEISEQLEKFYHSSRSFLPYQIGVFIPAYTRYFLLYDIVSKIPDHVLYCDTDSAKVIQMMAILPIVKQYNEKARKMVTESLKRNHYEATFEDLGIFDHETKKGAWKEFKTFGAKKYILRTNDGHLEMTVSGLSKKAVNYLTNIEEFKPFTTFDKEISGRTISHPTTNEIETYDNGATWIEDTTYTLSIAPEYAALIGIDIDSIVPTIVKKNGIVENTCMEIHKKVERFQMKTKRISPTLEEKYYHMGGKLNEQ